MRVVAILVAGLLVGACTGAAAPGSGSPAATSSPVASTPAPTGTPTSAPTATQTATPTTEPATPFPSGSQTAEPLPPDRYAVSDFTPPFELALAEGGWSGGSAPGVVVLSLDGGYYTRLMFGRFEGIVMPDHCTDDRATIGASPDALVQWLTDNPALSLVVTPASVGGLSGVRVEIHAQVKRPCTADTEKASPEFLWVDPGSVGARFVDTGERLVAYLLDDGEATVTITFTTTERELDPFLAQAEPLLDGVTFLPDGS